MVTATNRTLSRDSNQLRSIDGVTQAADSTAHSVEAVRLAVLLPEVLKRYGLADDPRSSIVANEEGPRPIVFQLRSIMSVGEIFTT
jgi:hypothetical protein